MPLTDLQLQTFQKQAAKPGEAGADAQELYALARLGLWARDVVMPLLRKLPAATTFDLPVNGKPVPTTIEAEVGKVFKACPQELK
jgi:hypothetical protein